jgi:nicotinamide-nucleotide amidase
MQDLIALATGIAAELVQRRETIAVWESSAGGLVSAALLAVPGASRYFLGGTVIYTHEARRALFSLPDDALKGIRSSSEPYAALAAKTVREKLATTWGLAESGAAGPSGNPYGDAPGHVCLAVSGPVERVVTIETASDDRVANMNRFAREALELLTACLANRSAAERA